MKQPLVVIVGPTAVGKTALSIDVAKAFNGEIISGDSLQVYKKLDIGTAKVTPQEMEGIPHHLIDVAEPEETYSAFSFKQQAEKYIEEIASRGKLPIIVGGTGMYIQSLLFDFDLGSQKKENQKEKEALRQTLTDLVKTKGSEALWQELQRIDSKGAQSIHPNNEKRVMRAIEVKRLTGESIVDQQGIDLHDLNQSPYDVKLIGLMTDRSVLYNRINQRVDQMMVDGLLEEARYVYELGPVQASQGIGYKEFFPYFANGSSLESCIEQVKQHSRHYAKRQLTWFRNRMTVEWWDLVDEPKNIIKLIENIREWIEEEGG